MIQVYPIRSPSRTPIKARQKDQNQRRGNSEGRLVSNAIVGTKDEGRGHESRNAGSLKKLKRARKQILPFTLREE